MIPGQQPAMPPAPGQPPPGGDPLAQLIAALEASGRAPDPVDLDPVGGDIEAEAESMYGSGGTDVVPMTGGGDAMDRAAGGNLYQGGSGGLPASRLSQWYQSWLVAKMPELINQLVYERYYHGKQFTEAELAVFARRGQPPTYFNELRKKVDGYVGTEQRLRRDPKGYPRTPAHEGDCDAATAALREVNDTTRSALVFSEAGRDFFVRGIGAIWAGGCQKNFRPEIKIEKKRIPAIQFIYDPRSMEWDFSDAKFLGEWAWFDIEDAEELFDNLGRPDSADMMRALAGRGDETRSGGVPGEWARTKSDWWSSELGRVRLVHLYYRYRGEWRCAYFCGQIKLYDEPSMYVDEAGDTRCPIMAASCNIDETGERYGVVKDLIPIQDSINARHSRLLWMMSVRQIIVEKGAVDDVNLAREQAKRPDGVIELNPRGQGGIERKFQIVTMDAEIAGQAKLLEVAMSQMANYGPNPAMMGEGPGTDVQSGRALLAKQNAGMTEMSPIFERHREFKIAVWRGDWLLVRQFYTEAKWFRVTDDEKGFKFVGLNQPSIDPETGQARVENDVAAMDIDIIIEEGPDTVTMNEELMQQLANLGDAALGPLGKVIITLSGARNKEYLFKLLDEAAAPNPQLQEMQAKMARLESLMTAAKVDSEVAKAEKLRAETMGKLIESMATPQMFQEFPLVWGAPTYVEQLQGTPANPNNTINAFMAPVAQPPPEAASPGGPPDIAPGGPTSPPGGMPQAPSNIAPGFGPGPQGA